MPSDSSLFLLLFFFIAFALLSAGHATIESDEESEGIGRRVLLGLKETPHGSNTTFECSPAGPCLPCLYSEKKDDKYRCSETGYRIPLKCIKIKLKPGSKEKKENGSQKSRSTLEISHSVTEMHDSDEVGLHRSVLDDSSKLENEPQAYISYRSCIPAISEEKLSVVGFEVIMLFLLLISGSLYFRKRQTASMSGFGRIPNNTRF